MPKPVHESTLGEAERRLLGILEMPTRSATVYQKCASTLAPDTGYISSERALKSSLCCVAGTRTAKSMTLGELSRWRLNGGK